MMTLFVYIIWYCLSSSIIHANLLDDTYIMECLTHEAPYHDSHGAKQNHLGAGMLYYALAYMTCHPEQLCVCLGSGGGFVPRMIKQAQRDMNIATARTVLVDGDMGDWGRPLWLEQNSFFKRNFPDIEIIIDTTDNIAQKKARVWEKKITYLHIDADHSFEGAWKDFCNYLPLMAPHGIITFHDTGNGLPCSKVISVLKEQGYNVINFSWIGEGTAIVCLP